MSTEPTGPTVDELGIAALPADASPAQRARAEALYSPVTTDQRCRCSGECEHGDPCPDCGTGHLMHIDRYPGSLFLLTAWADDYVCDHDCGYSVAEQGVELPELPWGEHITGDNGRRAARCFPDVRHPNFPE